MTDVQNITVTGKDGETHTFEGGTFEGIWSGKAIIKTPGDLDKFIETPDAVQSYNTTFIDLAEIDRLEFPDTYVNLAAPGLLDDNNEVDMTL